MSPIRSAPEGSPHGLCDVLLAHVFEPRQVVDAGAADDAENGLDVTQLISD